MAEPGSEGARPPVFGTDSRAAYERPKPASRKRGRDIPGGATKTKPSWARGVGDHSQSQASEAQLPSRFGEAPPTRGRLPSRQLRETVVPAGLIQEQPEEDPGLQIGDVLPLDSGVIRFEEYKLGQWREAGTVSDGDYTLTRVVQRRGKPLFEFTREYPDSRPTTHVFIKPKGGKHGSGWVRVKRGS